MEEGMISEENSWGRVALIRVRRFAAWHRYWRSDRSAAENREAFGPLSETHPHHYRLEVAVGGLPDPRTGFLLPLDELDGLLDRLVSPLEQRSLEEVIPEMAGGRLLPSTEALAGWFWTRLVGELPEGVALERVTIWESDTLGAERRR